MERKRLFLIMRASKSYITSMHFERCILDKDLKLELIPNDYKRDFIIIGIK